MKSIRSWLFGMFPLVAIASLIAIDLRKSVVITNDWRDLTVIGRGYIETLDDNGVKPIWFRSVRMGIVQFGLLSAHVGGVLRPFEPPVNVPSDWTRIDIDTKGQVTIGTSSSSGISIGSISLTTFWGEDVNEDHQIENAEDQMGPPSVSEPGSGGTGYLKQSAAIQYCLPLNVKSAVTFSFVVLWIVAGIATNRKMGRPA